MLPKETGERIYPKYFNEAYADHRNRYYFATSFIKRGDKVLDISCGGGYGSWFMAITSGAKKVVGIDISEEALNFAEEFYNYKNVIYKKADITKNLSKIVGEKFNLIISFETIEHIKDDVNFLINLYHILEDEGILLVSSPNEDKIPYNNNPFFEGGINPYHYKHYTSHELEDVLNQAGFKVVKKYTQEIEIYPGDNNAVLIFLCRKKK